MSPNHTRPRDSKFTRGEKCIFVHLIITFVIIITLIIVYFVHLCLVNHTRNDVFKTSLRTGEKALDVLKQHSIGLVYLNITPAKIICNTLLLRHRWSLAPAQCTSMRSDPDMSQYLPLWKIKYKNYGGQNYETEIKRTLTHSHFNRDDYNYNIGLFEHQELADLKEYVVPKDIVINDEILIKYSNDMNMFGWKIIPSIKDAHLYPDVKRVRPISPDRWKIYVAAVRGQLSTYEFCVVLDNNGLSYTFSDNVLDHGALFVMNSNVIGFFSWGDVTGRGVPLTILNIIHFRDWFENIISL